jgi:alpha-mannosidase
MNTLIKREFNPFYDIRKNLPQEKGIEVKNNTAPMQRGLLIDEDSNNIGIITKGLTQYEIFENNLMIPILRSTGQISNPKNPARTTPAGPPIKVEDAQMIGDNIAEFNVFFGNENAFYEILNQIYNYIIV